MNRNQFISYINHPDKLSGSDSVVLAELLKNFPYFQTAHLLYAKSLHNQHSIHYNNQLKITAAYATDRKVLHRLITKQFEPKIVLETVSEIKMEVPVIKKVIDDKIELIEITEIDIVVLEKEEIINELEKEYLSQVAIATIELEVLNTKPFLEEDELIEEEEIIIESNPLSIGFVLNTPVFDDSQPHSFLDWLKHSSLKASESPKEEIKIEKIIEKNPIAIESENDLINKFLKEEPRLSKPKVEFYNPVNMAKQSVADDITFVTETLAKIFMMQGNNIKALEAYENLRLKYPEKRLYFASQIKNLRKLINQQKQ